MSKQSRNKEIIVCDNILEIDEKIKAEFETCPQEQLKEVMIIPI